MNIEVGNEAIYRVNQFLRYIGVTTIIFTIIIGVILLEKSINKDEVGKKNKTKLVLPVVLYSVVVGLFISISWPSIIYMFESKEVINLQKKYVYVEKVLGSNGDSIKCDDNKEYHFIYEGSSIIGELKEEFYEEWCVIEYYRYSKVLVSINRIDDVSKYGYVLTEDEIERLEVPIYPGDDVEIAPSNEWEWKEDAFSGGNFEKGNWYKDNSKEVLSPNLNTDQPFGSHWDWKSDDGIWYRLYPDGMVVKLVYKN